MRMGEILVPLDGLPAAQATRRRRRSGGATSRSSWVRRTAGLSQLLGRFRRNDADSRVVGQAAYLLTLRTAAGTFVASTRGRGSPKR